MPGIPVALQPLQQFRIAARRNVGRDRLADPGFQFRPVNPPEVAEEDPLHALRAEDLRRREEGREEGQVGTTPAFLLEHVVAEQHLRVPGDQGAVEVEEREAPAELGALVVGHAAD